MGSFQFPLANPWLNKVVMYLPYVLLIALFVSAIVAQSESCGEAGLSGALKGLLLSLTPNATAPRLIG